MARSGGNTAFSALSLASVTAKAALVLVARFHPRGKHAVTIVRGAGIPIVSARIQAYF
jgi:hypothetical protein